MLSSDSGHTKKAQTHVNAPIPWFTSIDFLLSIVEKHVCVGFECGHCVGLCLELVFFMSFVGKKVSTIKENLTWTIRIFI